MDIISFLLGYASKKGGSGGSGSGNFDEVDKLLDEINGEVISVVVYTVTFVGLNGEQLYRTQVYEGEECPDPIESGAIAKPVKESTAQFRYEFAGWATSANGSVDENAFANINENRTLYAVFKEETRKYNIRFLDTDGTVLKTMSVYYGTQPSAYTPEKDGFVFLGWTPDVATVTGEASYTATWHELTALETMTWAEIAEVSRQGDAASTFGLGDSKLLTLTFEDGTTETTEAILIGIDHDDLADGSGKAGLTFQIKALDRIEKFNESEKEWNGITSLVAGGWMLSDIKNKLNTSYLSALPSDVAPLVRTVLKESAYVNENTAYGMVFELCNTLDKLWLLSIDEVFADLNQASANNAGAILKAEQFGSGTQYGYYGKNGFKSVMEEIGGEILLRTQSNLNNAIGTKTFSTGKALASKTDGNVSFCFCI